MQSKIDFDRNNCIEILLLIIFVGILYTIFISCLKKNENFATTSPDGNEETEFESYIQAAIDNKFTNELWEEINELTLMYSFIYEMLTTLGKKPPTYSLTIEEYYKTKENFISDLLKLYSKN